VPHIYI
jgi:hypothetical protein